MDVKIKAKELIDRYFKDYGEKMPDGNFMLCVVSIGRAKQCALIAVDEIIKSQPISPYNGGYYETIADRMDDVKLFWEEVKKEITLLK